MLPRTLAAVIALTTSAADAQDAGQILRRSKHVGEMTMSMPGATSAPAPETLMFEPWQMIDDLFRNDIVLLMRHGPTDWSQDDVKNVAPTDCANQRLMTPEGRDQMRDLGILLAGNGIVPGRILASEWCRNQQTLDALIDGIGSVARGFANRAEIGAIPSANLLLSLQGAENVTELRRMIVGWRGSDAGPLLIISHFTNIAELTEFHVYEGEILVLDPDLQGRVIGYLRLRSAGPDVGHFDVGAALR